MHFQYPPAAETKLVRATRGAILDIIVDLRPGERDVPQHIAVELSADNHRALYVPERFAHGYQALEDDTETSYQVGEFYTPGMRRWAALRRPPPRAASGRCRSVRCPTRTTAGSSLDEIEPELKRADGVPERARTQEEAP